MEPKKVRKNICTELICFQFFASDSIGKIRNDLREMVYYIIFLLITTVAILFVTSQFWINMEMYNMSGGEVFKGENGATINIFQISNFAELWTSIEHLLLGNIYWIYWSNAQLYEYKEQVEIHIIGTARMRQIRVQKMPCSKLGISTLHDYCYPAYSAAVLETAPFGLQNSSAWNYNAGDEGNKYLYSGLLYAYPPGGYCLDFPRNRSATRKLIKDLKNNIWIDRQTRAIFIEYTVYNGNLNFFSAIKILFEIPPTGGIETFLHIKSLKLIPYVSLSDYFVLACETICMFFLIHYLMLIIIGVINNCRAFFQDLWNVFEVIILSLFLTIVLIRLYMGLRTLPLLKQMLTAPNTFIDFDEVGYVDEYLNAAYGVFLFCLWFKVFKYFRLSRTFGQLNATISKCMHDLAAFLSIFFMIFTAYALLGYQLFGSVLVHFCTIPTSIFTLLKSVNGEFHYEDIEKASKIVGPLYFVTFIFIVFFVLLNMFIAIVCDSYTMVKAEISGAADEAEVSQFMKRGAQRIFRKIEPIKALFIYKETIEALKNVKKVLKLAKYKEREIKLLFAEYDFGDDDIDEDEIDDFFYEVDMGDFPMHEAAQFIRSIKHEGTILTGKQLQRQYNELKILEQNVLKLDQIVDELEEGERIGGKPNVSSQ